MGKNQIGEFEEIVILTVGILYGDAYGVSIKKEIESRLKRKVSVGALQSALVRLENKNFLVSNEGGNTSARGGRPKRYFTITALGKQAIQQTRDMRNQLYNSIPEIALEVKFS